MSATCVLYATRRAIFDEEVHRVWERRVNAADEIGDGIFLVYARGTRPLEERLSSIASRLEAAPRHIEQQKTRLGSEPPVLLWNEMELESVESLPTLFEEIVNAAKRHLGEDHAETKRLASAAAATSEALDGYAAWVRERLGAANNDYALGSDRYDTLVGLRAFDDLDTDAILAIGEEQLALNKDARRRIALQIDADATELDVLDRIKSDHPADFEGALQGYRSAMDEARRFVIEHGIASLAEGEEISVIETPEFLRNVLPFAAYFPPPKFGTGSAPKGLYVVTPSSQRRGRRHA